MKDLRHFSFFFFCCFVLLGKAHAQQFIVNWTKFIGCSDGPSVINHAIATDDGGILFTGYSNCNNSGDLPPVVPTYQNLIVGKLDASHQLSWIRAYGGSASDEGDRICKTSDGGYVILGLTHSSDGDITDFKGTGDVWLLKIDASGNKVWSKAYGSSSAEMAISIAATPDDGFIVLAVSNGNGDDVPSHYGSSPFLKDWFVFKVDGSGNKQWAKSVGGSGDELVYGCILSVDTSYYLFGASDSKDYECTDNNWNPGLPTKYDGYILKLDQSGNVVWDKTYGGTDGDDFYSAIFDDRDSSFVMAGLSGSNDYYATGNHTNKGYNDFWVVKTDMNGNLKWSKMIGGQKDEQWPTIIKGRDNGYMLCGYTTSGIYGTGSGQGIDGWIFSLNSSGDVLKDKIFGGNKHDTPNGFISYENGFFVCGRTLSDSFAEGTNSSRWPYGLQAFISKLEYFPASVPEIRSIEPLAVYPNPAEGKTTIIVPQKKKGTVNVFDNSGKLVYTQQADKKTEAITIDTATWPNGIYTILLDTGDGKGYQARLVKN